MKKSAATKTSSVVKNDYSQLLGDVTRLLDSARRQSARSVNAILTVTYWLIGRRIVEFEQSGRKRAEYGEQVLEQLSSDLIKRFGRGFSRQNLQQMRQIYLTYSEARIRQTLSGKFHSSAHGKRQTLSGKLRMKQQKKIQTLSGKFDLSLLTRAFPLTWSHYVRLLSVESNEAREFYEVEAFRGGWSVRQLDRQIATRFYERTLLSKNKSGMLKKGAKTRAGEVTTVEEEIKDPYVLEFLGLKDEYSESDLEEALIMHLEKFLLELGGDFTFVGRQKRLRIGNMWYRVDLIFYHRKLQCLVVIDLKVGKFTHADAGQMHLYLNYAREHWINKHENPPVGLILCTEKDTTVAKYALEGLPNKILAAEYELALPDEKVLINELKQTRMLIEARRGKRKGGI